MTEEFDQGKIFEEMLAKALENSAAGNVKDLGDFTQYADDEIDEALKEN